MSNMTLPPSRRPWMARLVALTLAAVSVPYCTVAMLGMRNVVPEAGQYVMGLLVVAAFVPSILRAYNLSAGSIASAPRTLGARVEHWAGALSATLLILFAAHLAFVCVCFPVIFAIFQLSGWLPASMPITQQLVETVPWVLGVVAASGVAYLLTERMLGLIK